MSYCSLHRTNERYELTVILLLIAAVLAAMVMMFVHPGVSIFIFWVGMIIAAVAGVIELAIRRRERVEVRDAINARVCPQCGSAVRTETGNSQAWCCDECGSEFTSTDDVLSLQD